jgi:phage terminase small subunit
MADLNAKQATFVREYLIDLNATQAAIRAGYSPKTAGQIGDENLRKPEIAAAVQSAMAERAGRTEITADRVLRELGKIGFADIRKAVSWQPNVTGMVENDDGTERLAVTNHVQLVSSDEIDDDTAAALAEVSQTSTGGLRVKLHDKRGALESIGRHLGMFKDRVEHSGPGGGPVQVSGEVVVRFMRPGEVPGADQS